jgi:hypothetical protein
MTAQRIAADVGLRQVPDEEDEEEEGNCKKDGDHDDETDDGYSDWACPHLFLFRG